MINLYPDQQEVIEATAASMRRGNRAVLMQSPTGSGKSVMASALVHRAASKGNRTWFIVPRRDLLRQMSVTYNNFGISHSYIAATLPFNPYSQAHIVSADTVKNRLDKLTPPNLAIIDECHFGGAGMDKIVQWLKAAGCYIIGLSATPWKLSGAGLGCWFDDMVLGKSIRWLIDNGRLSSYRGFAPYTPDMTGVGKSGGDYAKGQLDVWARENRVRVGNAVNHYKEHAMGKLGIAYCVGIDDSKRVAAAFNGAGVPAAHIDGTTPDAERQSIIRAYADRKILMLTNCELLTFGFDLASQVGRDVTVECMSDLRPTKSLALQMQKWGRVLRMKDEPALIFDHAGNFNEHGFPCDERDWTLEDRQKASRASGDRSLPFRQCDKCFYCHKPAPTCPNCGHVYPIKERSIEEVEGELAEIEVAKQKRVARMEVGMAKTMDDLKRIADERGYKRGWILKQAQLKRIRT